MSKTTPDAVGIPHFCTKNHPASSVKPRKWPFVRSAPLRLEGGELRHTGGFEDPIFGALKEPGLGRRCLKQRVRMFFFFFSDIDRCTFECYDVYWFPGFN